MNLIGIIAAATHMANRAYCIGIGDNSQPTWEDAPEWQRKSAVLGVAGALSGNTPEQSHQGWLREKEADGWKYGPVKNPELKEHPCFVPYTELPPEQKLKDTIFITTAKSIAKAVGYDV